MAHAGWTSRFGDYLDRLPGYTVELCVVSCILSWISSINYIEDLSLLASGAHTVGPIVDFNANFGSALSFEVREIVVGRFSCSNEN